MADFLKKEVRYQRSQKLKVFKNSFYNKRRFTRPLPYGFIAVPKEELVRMHSSSRTTGRATVVFHTINDIAVWSNLLARCMYMAGMRKSDVFQNMMTYGLFYGWSRFHYGAEKIGALIIPAGAGNSKKADSTDDDFETTAVHVIPSYALHLSTIFDVIKLDPREDTKVKIAFLGRSRIRKRCARRLRRFTVIKLSTLTGFPK